MATTAPSPVTASASVSTTPVLRLVAVAEPVVQPLTVQWWGLVPWIDDHNGWPLWWSDRPANAKDWVRPAISQKKAGKLVVEMSLAPGATLDAQPRTGWDVPVIAVSSPAPRTITEVLRLSGQVATTAHVPVTPPRVQEHDVLDAERGTRLVPSISSAGVLWVPRPAVGYVVVEYEARMVTLEAEFGITTAPWTAETRQRVLHDLVFAGKAEDTPPLMIRVQVRDPETRKTQSEMVQANMALLGLQNNFGGAEGDQRDVPADTTADQADDALYVGMDGELPEPSFKYLMDYAGPSQNPSLLGVPTYASTAIDFLVDDRVAFTKPHARGIIGPVGSFFYGDGFVGLLNYFSGVLNFFPGTSKQDILGGSTRVDFSADFSYGDRLVFVSAGTAFTLTSLTTYEQLQYESSRLGYAHEVYDPWPTISENFDRFNVGECVVVYRKTASGRAVVWRSKPMGEIGWDRINSSGQVDGGKLVGNSLDVWGRASPFSPYKKLDSFIV